MPLDVSVVEEGAPWPPDGSKMFPQLLPQIAYAGPQPPPTLEAANAPPPPPTP